MVRTARICWLTVWIPVKLVCRLLFLLVWAAFVMCAMSTYPDE